MGKRNQKNYTKEFKEDVINYYRENDFTQQEVAEKFDVNITTLKYWLQAKKKHQEEAFVGSGNLRPEEAELKALKRKLYDLEEENAILKKAMAIFSRK
jgi:transposase